MKTFKFRLTNQAWCHMLIVPTEAEESLESQDKFKARQRYERSMF